MSEGSQSQHSNPPRNSPSIGSLATSRQTYEQYINQLGGHIDDCSSEWAIDQSLAQMRIVVKELNLLLNKMMDSNYENLAQRRPHVVTVEKELELLQARIDNNSKYLATQDAQITNLCNKTYQMEGKEAWYQQLIDQISAIRQAMPGLQLHSKHSLNDINRNGYALVNRQQDTSQALRLNALRADIDRSAQVLRKMEEKERKLEEKIRELQERDYEISDRLDRSIEHGKDNRIELADVGSLRCRYDQLVRRKQQQMKKNAVLVHANKGNQNNLQKKIGDLKKLLKQYHMREQMLVKKIAHLEKQGSQCINRSNVIMSVANKSLPLRFAETLLRGERQQQLSHQVKDESKYQDDFQDTDPPTSHLKKAKPHDNHNRSINSMEQQVGKIKPALVIRKRNLSGDNKYSKSHSLQQMPAAANAKVDVTLRSKRYSPTPSSSNLPYLKIPSIGKSDSKLVEKSVQPPSPKLWKQCNSMAYEPEQQKLQEEDYKVSKPMMSMKTKAPHQDKTPGSNEDKPQQSIDQGQKSPAPVPNFSRLGPKRFAKRMSDEYMDYLEEKGRKILGLS